MKHEAHQVKAGSVELSKHALDNVIVRIDVPQNENTRTNLDCVHVTACDDGSCEVVNNTEDSLVTANLISSSVVKDHKNVDYMKSTNPAPVEVAEFVNKTLPEDRPQGQDQLFPLSEPSSSCQMSTSREYPTSVESETIVVGGKKESNLRQNETSTTADSNETAMSKVKSNSGQSEPPCGPSSESNDVEVSEGESKVATTSNKMPISESDSNYTPSEVATTAESNEAPFNEREPHFNCDRSSSQDEKEKWGETLSTTASMTMTGACSGSDDLPTDTKSSVSTTDVPGVSDSDCFGCRDESATPLDANKANVTVNESTKSSQADECDTPPNIDDAPDEHKVVESELDECTGPDGIAMDDMEIASQPDCHNADSPSITEADRKPDTKTSELATCSKVDCHPSTPHEPTNTNCSDTVPLSEASFTESSSMKTMDVCVPSFLYLLIALYLIPPVSSLNRAANLNISISNVTEIVSMMLGNGSETYSAPDQSETLAAYWTIAISFAIGIAHLVACCQPIFDLYIFILELGMRACTSAYSTVWHVLCLLFEYVQHRSSQRIETVLPLSSAPTKDVQNNVINTMKCLVPPAKETTPPRAIENSFEMFECSRESESVTLNSKHLQQSIESGYQSMPPMPLSSMALPSGKDGHVRKPVFNTHSTSIQSELSSPTTEPGSAHVLEPLSSPPPTNKERTDHSSTKVECTQAENCDPGELVSIGGFRKNISYTAVSRGEVQQEETQPGEGRSEFAGPTQRCREQNIQQLPPQVIVVPPQANVEPSPIQTVALPIDPSVQVLAFNATVDEAEHESPDPPEDVPNHTPITLEDSFFNPEQGLRLNVGLADAEVHMYQLQALPFTRPHVAIDDAANSAPVYPPLPGVLSTNAELHPVFPPLPAIPST